MLEEFKRSIILLVSLMALEMIINAEDYDDLALAKINKLFVRSPRIVTIDDKRSRSINAKDELESKLSDLLEFRPRDDYVDTRTKTSTTFDDQTSTRPVPVNNNNDEENKNESLANDGKDNVNANATKNITKRKSKHAKIMEKIREKLTDKEKTIKLSPLVALIIVASIIFVTCCCTLYLRNRLIACIRFLTGRKKKKNKRLAVDSERGRSPARSRKKSVSSRKKLARSLSEDFVNTGTQKSSTMIETNDNDEPSTTGCYNCCKKKNKHRKKNRK